MRTIAAGVDLAKLVFSICMVDAFGHVLQRRDMKRDEFVAWLAQVPKGTVIAMEACSGAHHWARRCLEHGLVPRLMAAQFVKPVRKEPAGEERPQRCRGDRDGGTPGQHAFRAGQVGRPAGTAGVASGARGLQG